MKYRNRYTGTIVEPSAEVAALNYAADPTWEEVTEEQKAPDPPTTSNVDPLAGQETPDPPANGNDDPPDAQKKTDPPINSEEDPSDAQKPPDTPEGQNLENGKEEPECSQSEQTATSQLNTPTNTSPSTTSPKASSKKGGQTSAKEKKKSGSA